jgi:hypothetical protein
MAGFSRHERALRTGETACGPRRRVVARAATLTALAGLLGACGASSADEPALGGQPRPQVGTVPAGEAPTPQRPGTEGAAPARSGAAGPSSAASGTPGYDNLVAKQRRGPASRFTPCNLVTRSEAQAIVGAPLLVPVEASQGPTCIYRDKAGNHFVTIGVERSSFESIRPRIRHRRRLKIAGRTAYCGTYGRETLYVVLSRRRVLSISAPCETAKRLASKAVPRLVR